eukprot:TRINITY_DN2293_c0_g2_i1.p1 TRINITY_DN2293_c0_g2~~TRINITY_DN2293_c0_g2_i1.p1  ORF type:complete len:372 (+),score=84.78 TRINITY_DN2293_c0_g2_i1:151-1116(+)
MGAEVNKKTGAGFSPLHAAAIIGLRTVCTELLAKGAQFHTPLHKAAFFGDLEYIKKEYPAINKADDVWKTAPFIFYAIGGNQLGVIQWLVERDGSEVCVRNSYGNTPLMCCTWSANIEIATFLIASKASVAEKSDSAMTPLLWSSLHGQTSMVQFLLSQGAALTEKQNDGCTVLFWAVKNGHLELVTYLLSNGCSINEKLRDGKSVVSAAIREGEVKMVEYLISQPELSLPEKEDVFQIASQLENNIDMLRVLLLRYHISDAQFKEVTLSSMDKAAIHLVSYYYHWPQSRLLMIGHTDPNSPLTTLPKEIITLILKSISSI